MPTPEKATSDTGAAGGQPARKVRVSPDGRLVLCINGKETDYLLERLEPHPDLGHPAYRVWKLGGSSEFYDVILTPSGPECSCPDFVFRRANAEKKCKHVEALRAVGLLTPGVQNCAPAD